MTIFTMSCHLKGYLAHIHLLCVLMCILTDLGSSSRIINKISGDLLQIFLYPSGSSVNYGIPSQLCSLTYVTIDDAILNILKSGKNTILAKIDIKSAFRLLPVHPADRYLLGMKWKDQIYIDHCIPFGLRSAPKLFNLLVDLLA